MVDFGEDTRAELEGYPPEKNRAVAMTAAVRMDVKQTRDKFPAISPLVRGPYRIW